MGDKTGAKLTVSMVDPQRDNEVCSALSEVINKISLATADKTDKKLTISTMDFQTDTEVNSCLGEVVSEVSQKVDSLIVSHLSECRSDFSVGCLGNEATVENPISTSEDFVRPQDEYTEDRSNSNACPAKRRRISRKIDSESQEMEASLDGLANSYCNLGESRRRATMAEICVPITDSSVQCHLQYKKLITAYVGLQQNRKSNDKLWIANDFKEVRDKNIEMRADEIRLRREVELLEQKRNQCFEMPNPLMNAVTRKHTMEVVHGTLRGSVSMTSSYQLMLPPGHSAVPDSWFQYMPFRGLVPYDTRDPMVLETARMIDKMSNWQKPQSASSLALQMVNYKLGLCAKPVNDTPRTRTMPSKIILENRFANNRKSSRRTDSQPEAVDDELLASTSVQSRMINKLFAAQPKEMEHAKK